MNEIIKSFDFNSHPVRVYGTDENPLFVATDVCAALEIVNAHTTMLNFPKDDIRSTYSIDEIGRRHCVSCVTEAGLYRLIFQSRKAAAEKFKTWVFSEVLPAIRKTGKYSYKGNNRYQPLTLDQYLAEKPDEVSLKIYNFCAKWARTTAKNIGMAPLFTKEDENGQKFQFFPRFIHDMIWKEVVLEKKAIRSTQLSETDEKVLASFWEELFMGLSSGQILPNHFKLRRCAIREGKLRVLDAITADRDEFPVVFMDHRSVFAEFLQAVRSRGITAHLDSEDLKATLELKDYWLAAPLGQGHTQSFNNIKRKCWAMRLDRHPEQLAFLAQFADEAAEQNIQQPQDEE